MKIGLATNDWALGAPDHLGRPTFGGAGWYRLGLPGRELRRQGFDVVEGTLTWSRDLHVFGVREWPGVGDHGDVTIHWDVDVMVLQRWMFASVAVETAQARRSGQVIVQDVDDHFWALDPANRAYETTDPATHPIENRDHYLAGVKAASAVTTSTPYLADALVRLGVERRKIHVIPNHVDLDVFAMVAASRPRRTSPVLGWVGATAWRSGDVETLRGTLGPLLDRHDIRAFHGGSQEGAETFAHQAGLDPEKVLTSPLAPIDHYPHLFRGLDVGIVPLRDVPFNRAKSTVKGLEYAAAGLPYVAQGLPEYVRLAGRGVGLVAHRKRDWVRHLDRLLTDEVWRAECGEVNRRGVEDLGIARGVNLWRDLYLDLVVSA